MKFANCLNIGGGGKRFRAAGRCTMKRLFAFAVIAAGLMGFAADDEDIPAVPPADGRVGTGGEVFYALDGSGDVVHRFATAGTYTFTAPAVAGISARVLLVGGGASGGYRSASGGGGGGGGGGGVTELSSVNISAGEVVTLTIGAGGTAAKSSATGGVNGGRTVMTFADGSFEGVYGGGGGGFKGAGISSPACGGGGATYGSGYSGGGGGYAASAGGAGGAGSGSGGGGGGVGGNGTAGSAEENCGAGGPGVLVDITGEDVEYGAGGQGLPKPAEGGTVKSGRNGTGEGGSSCGAGGSGAVIIRYSMPSTPSAPVISGESVEFNDEGTSADIAYRLGWAGLSGKADVSCAWGTSPTALCDPISIAAEMSEGVGVHTITGLTPGTQYYVRFFAQSDETTGQSAFFTMTPVALASGGTGGVITRLKGGEFVHVFTNAAESETFTAPEGMDIVARILLVGGGGSGGGSKGASVAGGAGGGGGVIETNGITFAAGATATVVVGAGGAASTDASAVGKNGGMSSVTFEDSSACSVAGGGGGGAGSTSSKGGQSAATGGGGGPTAGKGSIGGNGGTRDASKYTGGGGGAGGDGENGGNCHWGSGGIGLASTITGENRYYGGGGGAHSTKMAGQNSFYGFGGAGGGGSGGAGKDGLGGGGATESKGGSGAVIIRYSLAAPVQGAPAVEIVSAAANADGTVTVAYDVTDVGEGGSSVNLTLEYGTTPEAFDNFFDGPQDVGAGEGSCVLTGLLPETTYYLRIRVENDRGAGAVSADAKSFLTPGRAGLSDLAIAVDATTFTVTGALDPVGVSAKTVRLHWGYDTDALVNTEEVVIADGAEDVGFEFVVTTGEWNERFFWRVSVSNECPTQTWVSYGDIAVKDVYDNTTYAWKTGVTSGAWSDSANWEPSRDDCRGYPNGNKGETAQFPEGAAPTVDLGGGTFNPSVLSVAGGGCVTLSNGTLKPVRLTCAADSKAVVGAAATLGVTGTSGNTLEGEMEVRTGGVFSDAGAISCSAGRLALRGGTYRSVLAADTAKTFPWNRLAPNPAGTIDGTHTPEGAMWFEHKTVRTFDLGPGVTVLMRPLHMNGCNVIHLKSGTFSSTSSSILYSGSYPPTDSRYVNFTKRSTAKFVWPGTLTKMQVYEKFASGSTPLFRFDGGTFPTYEDFAKAFSVRASGGKTWLSRAGGTVLLVR